VGGVSGSCSVVAKLVMWPFSLLGFYANHGQAKKWVGCGSTKS